MRRIVNAGLTVTKQYKIWYQRKLGR